jgi:hypothetical protein
MSRRTLFALVALWSVSVGCVADLASIPCLARELYCDGRCVDPTRDRAHCGACGRACDGLCRDSACVPCPGGQSACGDACVDLSSDDAHCGACDVSCPDNVVKGAAVCRAGACVAACVAGFADCNNSLDDGCEVSIARDPSNCGACGAVCPAGTRGMATCAGGVCGAVVCPPGSGFADCNRVAADGCEVNTSTDVNSCGMCGTRCMLADATAGCALGACTVERCNEGFGDCNGLAADGCEVDLRVTVDHCGMCGRACVAGPHSTSTCMAGTCGLACEVGWADCNGMAADGCEVNIGADVNNCGMCGARCTIANGTAACAVGACAPGFRDCDGRVDNGCETRTDNDVANCGVCRNRCALVGATAACAGGSCVVAACAAGRANCNGLARDGCEVDLATSDSHCGRCGVNCGSANCVSGACRCADAAYPFLCASTPVSPLPSCWSVTVACQTAVRCPDGSTRACSAASARYDCTRRTCV